MIQHFDAIAGDASSRRKFSVRSAPLAANSTRALAGSRGSGRRNRTLVDRPFLGQRVRGNFRGHAPVMQHAQHAVVGDAPDLDRVESPLGEDVEDFALAAALGDQQHALLRFAEHHFVRRHAGFALRHAREFDFDSQRRRATPFRELVLVSPAAPMS